MQKRKIEDSKIWEAYKRSMAGESLTSIANAEDINIDRGTLKKYIKLVVAPNLEDSERAEFEQIINGNFRGNSTENKRQNRSKKKKVSAEDLSEQMKTLAELGVTGTQIEALYILLRGNKHTAYARDTFTFKCVEHFRFFNSIGISTQDAFDLFMRNPKAFTSDTRTIEERYLYFLRKTNSREKAREALLSNPRGKNKDLITGAAKPEINIQTTIGTDSERGED